MPTFWRRGTILTPGDRSVTDPLGGDRGSYGGHPPPREATSPASPVGLERARPMGGDMPKKGPRAAPVTPVTVAPDPPQQLPPAVLERIRRALQRTERRP